MGTLNHLYSLLQRKCLDFSTIKHIERKKTTRSKGKFDSQEFDIVMAMEDASVINVADHQGKRKGNWVGH